MLITNNIFLDNYLDIDLTIPGSDPEDVNVNIEIEFKAQLAKNGLQLEVNQIKSVNWRYNGGEDWSDESYNITYNKKKTDELIFGLYVSHINIDVANKTINIEFES